MRNVFLITMVLATSALALSFGTSTNAGNLDKTLFPQQQSGVPQQGFQQQDTLNSKPQRDRLIDTVKIPIPDTPKTPIPIHDTITHKNVY